MNFLVCVLIIAGIKHLVDLNMPKKDTNKKDTNKKTKCKVVDIHKHRNR